MYHMVGWFIENHYPVVNLDSRLHVMRFMLLYKFNETKTSILIMGTAAALRAALQRSCICSHNIQRNNPKQPHAAKTYRVAGALHQLILII